MMFGGNDRLLLGGLMRQDGSATEGVDKGRAASSRGTTDHHCELDALLDMFLTTHL